MRPLTESETHAVFSKLATYTGRSLTTLVAPASTAAAPTAPTDLPHAEQYRQHVFRLHRARVYYVSLALANLATNVARAQLAALGTCLGRFTKAGAFRLHVTALDVIAPHARARVWVKPQGEMPFLYGGNVLKAHVGRWTEDMVQHQGVVVCSMSDTPLGFGVTAKSTAEARRLDSTGVTVFRQADVGEYLREEDTLFAA